MNLPTLSPSEFVALVNQTLEIAYPVIGVEGEVSNLKIIKNRWVYFDLKDEFSSVRCFGTIYNMPGPVENGMVVRVVSNPRLHPRFGFSLNIQSLEFSGEGTIKKAADLLMQKLEKEGLFADDRKRVVPYPPKKIALVTSGESAAYKDFIKVLGARYGGLNIEHIDVAVQGESASSQIVAAIEFFNHQSSLADALVMIRGGGSSDDLQVFSSEQVTRAVSASRIPTVVAIGHETDLSLAELAADLRASTPSNAAELLVPDRKALLSNLEQTSKSIFKTALKATENLQKMLEQQASQLIDSYKLAVDRQVDTLTKKQKTIEALSPLSTLKRGYSIVRANGKVVRQSSQLNTGEVVDIEFAKGKTKAEVKK